MNINYYNQQTIPEKATFFSAGYSSEKLNVKTVDGLPNNKYSGGELVLGKIFKLDNDFQTTIFLKLNVQENKKAYDVDGSSLISKFTEIGVAQRLSLNIGESDLRLKPFIEVGAYRGRLNHSFDTLELDNSNHYVNTNVEADVGYWKYGGALGFELVSFNTIVPFIKYEKLFGSFDKNLSAKVSAGSAAVTATGSTSILYSSNNFDSSKISLGLGILF